MTDSQHKQPQIFYGWWVVVACLISMTIAGGVCNFTFSVFIKPLAQEFGWTRAEVSGGIGAFFLAVAMTAPFVGRLIGSHGARKVMLPAAFVAGLCFMLLSQVTSLAQLYGLRFCLELAFTAMAHIPVNVTLSRWCIKKRGRASGFALIAAGGMLWLYYKPLPALHAGENPCIPGDETCSSRRLDSRARICDGLAARPLQGEWRSGRP